MRYHDVDIDVLTGRELHSHPSGHHACRGLLFFHHCYYTCTWSFLYLGNVMHRQIVKLSHGAQVYGPLQCNGCQKCVTPKPVTWIDFQFILRYGRTDSTSKHGHFYDREGKPVLSSRLEATEHSSWAVQFFSSLCLCTHRAQNFKKGQKFLKPSLSDHSRIQI